MQRLGICDKCGAENILPKWNLGRLWFNCACGYSWCEPTNDAKEKEANSG